MNELILDCDYIEVKKTYGSKGITAILNDVDDYDICRNMKDLIKAVDDNEGILDIIGKEACIEHFKIEEKEDEG